MPPVPPLLHVDGVTKSYGVVQVLPSLSFELHPGQCVALTGPNGSGKSTALGVVLGTVPPTTGQVSYRGRPLPEARRDHRTWRAQVVGVMGANPYYRDLSLREHLTVIKAAWPAGMVTGEVEEVLEAFMLQHVARQVPGELSSGQAQLFALACACYRPSDLLVIDEPEQNLDPTRRAAVGNYLAGLKTAGRAVLLATHAPDLEERLANHVFDLDPGRTSRSTGKGTGQAADAAAHPGAGRKKKQGRAGTSRRPQP